MITVDGWFWFGVVVVMADVVMLLCWFGLWDWFGGLAWVLCCAWFVWWLLTLVVILCELRGGCYGCFVWGVDLFRISVCGFWFVGGGFGLLGLFV